MRGFSRLLWVVGVLCLAASCGRPSQLEYEERLRSDPPSAQHAAHSKRLAALMRGLDRVRSERLPKAMDPRIEQERRAGEIRGVARAIAASARAIGDVGPTLELDEDEQLEFVKQSEELRTRAEALVEATRQLDYDEWRTRLDAIDETCRDCHGRFRPGGLREIP